AFIVWRLDRRPPPGHCNCGYDLTGNVSGRCPECGMPCQAAACEMRQHSRIRVIAKWAGLAACLLLVATGVLTMPSQPQSTAGGARSPHSPGYYPRGWTVSWKHNVVLPDCGFYWAVLLPCASLTAWLWWRDTRSPPGHCRCGHVLMGNMSGVCPKCGTACTP